MTELKLSTAAEVTKPVEEIVEVGKAAVVDASPVNDAASAAPAEVAKVEKIVTPS